MAKDLSKPINPDQGPSWFLPLVFLICVVGMGSVIYLATQRTSNIGVAPLAPANGLQGDHWHQAFGVYNCGEWMPDITQEIPSAAGIHTHGSGLIHIHPFAEGGAGVNANMGAYFKTTQSDLTDSKYTPGPFEPLGVELDESAGCDGEPATLQIVQWEDALSGDEPSEIVTKDLAKHRFTGDRGAIVLALVPDGTDVPLPPSAPIVSQYSPESPLTEDGSLTIDPDDVQVEEVPAEDGPEE